MPELPEVETIKRTLAPKILGKTIYRVEVYLPKIIKNVSVEEFTRRVVGKEIVALKRRGKYLLIDLSGKETVTVHLRMTGKLLILPKGSPKDKHTHAIFDLGDLELHFNDIRQFGGFSFEMPEIGPEPLEDEFTPEYLKTKLKASQKNLKAVLLDQKIIAGIGNIYADEILFEAGLSPKRIAASLSEDEAEELFKAIRKILALGIEYRGTSIRDYVDAENQQGSFQRLLKVYGKNGSLCVRCNNVLIRERHAGRSTHYCPHCQK
ncbi:bifunctional DNA-formamidopyrimidine glycosylase/DNA-(apurinic or apyrimidinic site) lyase [Carboxydothermus hydrogenoformans]|uniref:Formamidopyrimidine-DNA glycosylase n=1 Tax=Carboxydothermus hydrogenoformans (strain ATCC BAA-161 / DSM 6008 / Z-2901) TaxID=246194 RepID=FPG_CARHZ|nr:bifunctional DNA-formamidopyrimidine glycosylase/DNA-(apurinic or apyrimidinic site) lyase [Carboxydothermus hydrogenoformans]Q3ABL4.3 RecName: Full=Formamidopyrimidine-DNA glycosylase; Short=Fapy-DNA glycosylase; AltName: Full=DNA-(apurinic or apyrimidinic site) lyase MutM; Short=AP lyase MutM [Carboxydothermus hydrogenoformans Z-2901]ABB15292.1 formamidopyrimidine-DNA glycosylase [Carboxydothermus hydrogenoformans Z-2901]